MLPIQEKARLIRTSRFEIYHFRFFWDTSFTNTRTRHKALRTDHIPVLYIHSPVFQYYCSVDT